MDLFKINLMQHGLIKQAKFLVSTPQKAGKVLAIMETGVVGIDYLPLHTGYLEAQGEGVKKNWANISTLKHKVYRNGIPTDEPDVLIISERDCEPLDPSAADEDTPKNISKPITTIASVRHYQARQEAGTFSEHRDLAQFIIQWCFIILLLDVIGGVLRGAFSG